MFSASCFVFEFHSYFAVGGAIHSQREGEHQLMFPLLCCVFCSMIFQANMVKVEVTFSDIQIYHIKAC